MCQHQKSLTMFPLRSIFAIRAASNKERQKLGFKKVVSRKRQSFT